MKIKSKIKIIKQNFFRPKRIYDLFMSSYFDKKIECLINLECGIKFKLFLPEYKELYNGNDFEKDVKAFMFFVLKKGMCFFDVGANIGFHTLNASKFVEGSGKVVSFEPIPFTFKVLNENTNHLKNVDLVNMAVNDGSHSSIDLKFYGPGFTGMSTSGFPRYASSNKIKLPQPETFTVQTISIDQYVKEAGISPDLIKIDIEGGEMDALKGACNVISEFKPAIIFEGGDNERTEINNTESCINYLQKHKYEIFEYDFTKSKIIKFIPKDIYNENINYLCLPS